MNVPLRPNGRSPRLLTGLSLVALTLGLTQLSAAEAAPTPSAVIIPPTAEEFTGLGDSPLGLSHVDKRGTALPTLAQKQAATALGATVRWNEWGTPSVVAPRPGVAGLGAATSTDAPTAARAWLRSNAAVLGVSAAQVDGLQLVSDQPLASGGGHAVLFRQRFGTLAPAVGGMVTVGVGDGKIAFVSSSLVRASGAAPAAVLNPVQGWLKAAQDVGAAVTALDVSQRVVADGWTRFAVSGLAQQQMARVRAFPRADGTVRPVVEANVVDVAGGSAAAYTSLVDAVTGEVLYRENKVEQATDAQAFQGAITATACGPRHPFEITDDTTRQIVVGATALNPLNDIVVKIYGPTGLLTSGDTGTSPETATYSSATPLAKGTYSAEVCPFADPTAPILPPYDYTGVVALSETASPDGGTAAIPFPPKWTHFLTNPVPQYGPETVDNRVVSCWVTEIGLQQVEGCTAPHGPLRSPAARAPWDVNVNTELPTFTTAGNNASTREAWLSPLTPGGAGQAPMEPDRTYDPEFSDDWNNSKCDPAQLRPGGNDVLASTNNLFVGHNRFHDFSYYLGFTEKNYNMQQNNFGNGGVNGDPEIGNVQAGAISGGAPSYLGRDNANQITLQDGVPGITNQYLFQPIAGAFYAPCTDGSFDLGIFGHEYTHAISGRMVGGPDEGLTSEQGGAMGESWSDLVAAEYQFEHGLANGGNVWAVGLYATGNKDVAIRNYAINQNPLTYGEYGYDSPGVEVHSDGEIWNAANWRVRQALVDKWNASFPYTNETLQWRCAKNQPNYGPLAPDQCPGNRRWLQFMFDSFLLQQGATDMLQARDAFLAADRIRARGANQTVIWQAFARSGMGVSASTPTADSGDVVPAFDAPTGNATVTFKPTLPNGTAVPGQVYIGTYEARATPLADTLTGGLPATAKMTPGQYTGVFQSSTGGLTRFTFSVPTGGGAVTRTIAVKQNLASAANGASVIGSTAGSLNPEALIDNTEATNWGGVTAGNVDVTNPFVAVDLAGAGATSISRVSVSALLRPSDASGDELPALSATDPDAGSRFTALRKFAIEVCASGCDAAGATWKRVYTSSDAAFPGREPRPVAPDLTLRSFTFPAVSAAAVRLVTLENQCTGYAGYAGEQDSDPSNATDCKTASDRGTIVHAAELEVYAR